jgi:putative hydrolase of HD superfamily
MRLEHLLSLGGMLLGLSWSASAAGADDRSPEATIRAHIEAYNARDMEAFVAVLADTVELYEHPAKLLAKGIPQMRERYAVRFREPNLHAEILQRSVMGNVVVDHERVTRTFPEGTGTSEVIAIYEVAGGRIAKEWLILGPRRLDAKP